MTLRDILRLGLLIFPILVAPRSATAGPPFVTDDPEPVAYQHVELDFFTQETRTNNGMEGVAPGLDANYGVAPDVELTLVAPLAFNIPNGETATYGYGDTQFSVKYRFIRESEGNWWPQVALYPGISIPTGNVRRLLGTGNMQESLPLYLQKDFDPWQMWGGVGYTNNPGAGNKNYWFFGGVLQRKMTDRLSLGGELFGQTSDEIGEPGSAGFNLGGTYDLDENYHILFAAGRGIRSAAETNLFSTYMALQVTY